MEIDPIRATLRHIVLLTKQYKESLAAKGIVDMPKMVAPSPLRAEALRKLENHERVLLEKFANPAEDTYEVDLAKAELAKQGLTRDELNLLEIVLEFHNNRLKAMNDEVDEDLDLDFQDLLQIADNVPA